MWKRIRIPLLAALAVCMLAAVFSWRMNFLNVPLSAALSDITGSPAAFSRVEYRLFNRVTLVDLAIGDNFRCGEVTVYFNPFKLLFGLRHPETSLTRIHFTNPRLTHPETLAPLIARLNTGGGGKASSLRITWENGALSAGSLAFYQFSGQVKTDGRGARGRMAARSGENTISLALDSRTGETAGFSGKARISGPDAALDVTARGNINEKGSITAAAEVESGKWNGFFLDGSTVSFSLDGGAFTGSFKGPMGCYATLSGSDTAHFDIFADLALEGLRRDAKGHILLKGIRDGDAVRGDAKLAALSFNSFDVGDINLVFSRVSTDSWKANGRMEPAGYTFAALVNGFSDLSVYLKAGEKGFGRITGSLSPLRLDTRLSGWPMAHLPVIAGMYPGLEGSLDITGEFRDTQWKLDAFAKECRAADLAPFGFSARFLGYGGDLFAKAESADQGWDLSGKLLKGGGWDLQLTAKDLDLGNLLAISRQKAPLEGKVTGTAAYSSSGKGAARLAAKNLSWKSNPLGNGRLDVEADPGIIHLRDLSLYKDKGTATARGELGRGGNAASSSLDLTFHHYPTPAGEMHGKFLIAGDLGDENGGEFNGEVASTGFSLGKWKAEAVRAALICSRQRIVLNDLFVPPFASGNATLYPATGMLHGKIAILSLSLGDVLPELQGRLQGTAEISGALDKPVIALSYSVDDTVYGKLRFAQSGTVRFSGGTVSADTVVVSSGSCKLTLNGELLPDTRVRGILEDFPVAMLKNFGAPDTGATGTLSGTIEVSGKPSAPLFDADLSGRGITMGKTPVSELTANLRFSDSTVYVDTFTAKFSDSEFRVLPASTIDIAARKFSLRSDCRNVHLGPSDLFGSLKLSGSWHGGGTERLSANAVMSGSDLWLNRHNIGSLNVTVAYKNDEIVFKPRGDLPVRVSGAIDLSAYPRLNFRKLTLGGNDQPSLVLDGSFGPSFWDFTVTGKSVPAEPVAELLGSPVPMTGSADITVTGRGSIDHPQIEAGLNVWNGTVSEVPFDNIDIRLSARQDVVTVIGAKLVRKNLYTISAYGFSPFFLTAEGKARVRNNPIDLSVNIDEGSLDVLRGIDANIRSARGGLRAQAHITGTLSNSVGNGYLRVANGEIQSKRYFNKLDGLNIDLSWKNNVLTVKEFSGRIDDGRMRVKGTVTLSGIRPKAYNLTWETEGGKGIPISIPELPIPTPLLKAEDWEFLSNYSRAEPRFSLRFTGPASGPTLAGWIELDNAHFTYPPLRKSAASGSESILDGLWPRLSWDLEIRSGKNCWFDNELVSVNTTGGIKLTGKGAYPRVNGRVETIRGTATYFGTEFTIRRAALDVVNEACFLQAEADSRTFGANDSEADTIYMYIDKADLATMQPRFISRNNPTLTSEQAMSRATGLNIDSMSPAEAQYYLRKSLIRFFDSSLTTPLAKGLLRRSGLVDTFHVQYKTQGQQDLPNEAPNAPSKMVVPDNPSLADYLAGTKYSMEKYLTDRMLFGYSMTFDQDQSRLDLRHELEVSYNLLSNLFLKGSYELETKDSLRQYDRRITLEQQFRFGWFGSPQSPPAKRPPKKTSISPAKASPL